MYVIVYGHSVRLYQNQRYKIDFQTIMMTCTLSEGTLEVVAMVNCGLKLGKDHRKPGIQVKNYTNLEQTL